MVEAIEIGNRIIDEHLEIKEKFKYFSKNDNNNFLKMAIFNCVLNNNFNGAKKFMEVYMENNK
jgi:hypothetical protein